MAFGDGADDVRCLDPYPQNPNLYFMASLGGPTSTWATPKAGANGAASLANLITTYSLKGIDINFGQVSKRSAPSVCSLIRDVEVS
jgi:hypothetical protein